MDSNFVTRSLSEACLTLLFGRIRVTPVSESKVLFLLVEVWNSILVGLMPSTVDFPLCFPSSLPK